MTVHQGASTERSETPNDSADTPEDCQRAKNSTDSWVLNSINGLHSRFDGIEERLRSIERRINYIMGGVAVVVAVILILGWILNPFLKAIAEKMISGG